MSTIEEKIDALSADIARLHERQDKVDELVREMMPIAKEIMRVGIEQLADAENAGYFRAGKSVVRAVDQVVRSHSPEELDLLGEDLVRVLNTARSLVRPEILQLATEAAATVERRDQLEPLGVVGLVRASSDQEVQRGLAVMMELLRQVGRAAAGLSQPAPKAARVAQAKHKGLEALAPRRKPVEAASCAVPSKPGVAAATVDGVAFTADGFLVDAQAWTPELAARLAKDAGVELTDAHWGLINFARKDFLETGVSPNIRRLSLAAGASTKDIYGLFKKAPGRTIARLSGIPKPAGCL